uniref:Uncharacterized protein n=1 Tax=Pyrodinium bahamense TaxID=73915 RepID=A0A7R9ZWL1_9DINO|mmetsp:Transcript_12824/g.35496  ORF Transcript_12824/g.35496 Transcript_12824/m.35496 type:complete len:175 (+) Transcript_12824:63-587(+)
MAACPLPALLQGLGRLGAAGRGCARSLPLGAREIACSVPRFPSMSCWGTSRRTSAPLLPEGHDYRERHHCGPKLYIGKTPEDIVARFKNQATFPWYLLPLNVRTTRFEVLWQQAHKANNREALKAVQVLMDAAHDRGAAEAAAAAPGATGAATRMSRSQKRALRSGVAAESWRR